MAKIYLWKPNLTNSNKTKRVGHLSLLLPDDGTYISFWPKGSLKLKAEALFFVESKTAKCLEEDIEQEGGLPDSVLEIPEGYINARVIRDYWREKVKQNYSFLEHNCAMVVKEALKIGCSFSISKTLAGKFIQCSIVTHFYLILNSFLCRPLSRVCISADQNRPTTCYELNLM